jgi:hypothetical protein
MRTTVGPLPPAVYWRRRALVLGALLLGVIVLFVSCSGGDDKNSKRGQGTSSQAPLPAPASSAPDDQPSFSDAKPGGGPSLPAPNDIDSNQPSLGDGTGNANGAGTGSSAAPGQNGTDENVTAATATTCGDNEMSVTPVPASATIRRGTPVVIQLKIKNIGTRTCNRDVGADPQEIYIDQGVRKYWSSDTCSPAHSSDVKQFTPGAEREYSVTWNGRQSSKCSAGLAAGPAPIPGQYQIRGRLGTKVSDPVTLTIVA